MSDEQLPASVPLQIHKPCSKDWGELVGDERKRFCSECSLHVHNAAQLTPREANALVTQATSRVCMRIEYDSNGAPIFRSALESAHKRSRLARWALSAAAGLLAACHGNVSTPAATDPSAGANGGETPSKMGKVSSTLMGDVATSKPVRMGEASVPEIPPVPTILDAPKPPKQD